MSKLDWLEWVIVFVVALIAGLIGFFVGSLIWALIAFVGSGVVLYLMFAAMTIDERPEPKSPSL